MTERRRVLVFGGSGWLGSAVVPRFRERFAVEAPSHAAVDVADAASVAAAVRAHRADTIVHLAAVNPPERVPGDMERTNVGGAAAVATAATAAGVRLIHMSTDLVLDGRSPPYADDAPCAPITPYGRTKAAGEAAVRAACAGALILRTSLVIDPGVPDRFTRSVMDRLARGEPATLFTDEYRCPISRGLLAAVLAELVERPEIRGALNVAGTQRISRMDLGLRLLRRFGTPRLDLVRPALAAKAAEPRPLDVTLDVSLARSLLVTPLRSVDEELGGAAELPRM